ncbi:transporter [Flavobacterium sp.]|uniref:transporter n=1 Tax=Flavobacterium sp. TaxID=239 RepID=UPI00248A8444|nr:transporter [Flavobacterium sp.]MDI1317668.1 transporter [Flavobacterium sp.]
MKKIILFLLLISNLISYSQETEPLQTDRPDQTETPALVPKGMFQVETGFSFQKNDATSYTNTLPSTLWKYGVNKNFELRLITEFVSEKTAGQSISGLNPILIGCKIKISDEKGFLPKTSFIGHVLLPNVASTNFKSDYFAPEFRFVMQHTLSKKMTFSYNLGAEWNGIAPNATFIYTVTTGYTFTNKFGSYIELFGFAPEKDKANHSFDGGITYLINNNFMLDLSSGIGITDNAPNHYIAVGFSFRI